jgi:hypothetical protein
MQTRRHCAPSRPLGLVWFYQARVLQCRDIPWFLFVCVIPDKWLPGLPFAPISIIPPTIVRFGPRIIAKSAYYVRHIRPSSCSAPTAQIAVQFIVGNLMKMCREDHDFLKPGINIGHFARTKCAIKARSLSYGIRLLGLWRRYDLHAAVPPLCIARSLPVFFSASRYISKYEREQLLCSRNSE